MTVNRIVHLDRVIGRAAHKPLAIKLTAVNNRCVVCEILDMLLLLAIVDMKLIIGASNDDRFRILSENG